MLMVAVGKGKRSRPMCVQEAAPLPVFCTHTLTVFYQHRFQTLEDLDVTVELFLRRIDDSVDFEVEGEGRGGAKCVE